MNKRQIKKIIRKYGEWRKPVNFKMSGGISKVTYFTCGKWSKKLASYKNCIKFMPAESKYPYCCYIEIDS